MDKIKKFSYYNIFIVILAKIVSLDKFFKTVKIKSSMKKAIRTIKTTFKTAIILLAGIIMSVVLPRVRAAKI